MTELHIFTNEIDWVIARDLDDAYDALKEHNGTERHEIEPFDPLFRMDDSEKLGIMVNSQGEIDDNGETLTLVADEWAKREGRGFLCSTEY